MLRMLARLFECKSPAVEPPGAVDTALTDIDALLAEAYRRCDAGDMSGAEAVLEQAIARRGDSAEAYIVLGQLQQRRGALDAAADAYTLATHHGPQMQKAWLFLGLLRLETGEYDAAKEPLERAVELDPQDPVAINALGAAQFSGRLLNEAHANFREALRIKPDFAEAHSNLGFLLFRDLEAYEEGEAHVLKALELAPDNEVFLCNHAMVLQQRGRCDEALALCDALLRRNPRLNEVRFNRGVLRLARGAFDTGWEDYEARRKLDSLPWPEWQGEPLGGKAIVVYTEQGIGDEIMFASCLPELVREAKAVTLACSAKVAELFRRSFPQAFVVVQQPGSLAWTQQVKQADVQIAAGSIPRYRRTTIDSFPSHSGYLSPDPRRVAYWRGKLDALPGRLKVGISWRGGAPTTRRSLRSVPLSSWGPILDVSDTAFVSVQYGDYAAELAALREESGVSVQVWREAIDDYSETASLVAALDVVVSVQTAIVHLAGACGVAAWALIPRAAEWRYMETGDAMPWYPSVRLFRQSVLDDWEAPVKAIALALRKRMQDAD